MIMSLQNLFMALFESTNHEVPPMWIRVEAEDFAAKGMPALQG